MGTSSEMLSLVCLDKSLWLTVRVLEAGELPAWELPLLGRACSAFCQQSCPSLPVNLAIPPLPPYPSAPTGLICPQASANWRRGSLGRLSTSGSQ